MRTIIKGGTIVNEGKAFVGSVVIEDERIVEVAEAGSSQTSNADSQEVIDATGCYVLPGVIDSHVHFREPGLTAKADIESESRAAAAGGVTSYFDMPNTVPQTTTLEALDEKFQLAAEKSHVNYSFFFGATNDNVGFFSQLNEHRIPGIKLFMGSSTGNMLVDRDEALERIFQEASLPLMTHCEDTDIINRNMAHYQERFGDDPDVRLHPVIRSEEACLASTIKALELGIPCKTRHNEVAPNQFELAPIFEETNLAVDHNMLMMSLMKKVARKHGFRCLLHEKPFAGVNGSGKHNNWSLTTDTGILLHAPGKTQLDNLRFITFIVETLMAVWKHNGLLKASIVSATNAHRLGANEAPPAIISSFLGKQLSDVLEHLEQADDNEILLSGKQEMHLGIPQIPEILVDNTDRNRTSPFAFTGNRFEFRAVGSEANCASAMIALNAAVAEALISFKERVDKKIAEFSGKAEFTKGGHSAVYHAIIEVLREDIKTCKPIHFDGNGYSEEWKQEAARRGLDVEASCPLVIDRYLDDASVKMFALTKVFNRAELEARNEIKWETYTKKIQIEARIFGDLCLNHIIPVATRYQSTLIDNVHKLHEIFDDDTAKSLSCDNISLIKQISEHTRYITTHVSKLIDARRVANRIESEREKAIAYHDTVAPLLEDIRYHVDKLELIVDDELWPLPKYREILFIR